MKEKDLIQYLKTTEDSIVERRKKIFSEATEYFGDNSCTNGTSCKYTPTYGINGCFIGRLIPLDLAKQLKYGLVHDQTYEKLPEYLKVLGRDFLMAAQSWHDEPPIRKFTSLQIKNNYLK
jgi:hypothetical protein